MIDTTQLILALCIVVGVVLLAWHASDVEENNQRPLVTAIALLIGLLTGGTVGAVSAGSAASEAVKDVRQVVSDEIQQSETEVLETVSDELDTVEDQVEEDIQDAARNVKSKIVTEEEPEEQL